MPAPRVCCLLSRVLPTVGEANAAHKRTICFQKMLADEEIPSGYFKSAADQEIVRVTEVRFRIIDCLEDFFRWRHHFDSLEENRAHRDYLRNYLVRLRDGDLIITLNWDSATERSLGDW